MNTTVKAPARATRYVVTTAPAFFSDDARLGVNRVVVVGTFARKGEALYEAMEALSTFRVCSSTVSRERWTEMTDLLTGRDTSGWMFDGTVKDFSRYLKPEERLTAEEEASR
jgi:hypothetical protein